MESTSELSKLAMLLAKLQSVLAVTLCSRPLKEALPSSGNPRLSRDVLS